MAGVGAFPEDLAVAGTVIVQNGNTQVPEEIPAANVIDTKRNLFQTLVFGPPAGTPLKMMTWNIKRFTSFMHFVEGLGNAGAFDDSQVPPQLIGQFIAPMDVVALQEAWDDADLQNPRRCQRGARGEQSDAVLQDRSHRLPERQRHQL